MPIHSPDSVPQYPTRKKPKSSETRWRTPTQERIYGLKLLQAIKSVRNSSSQPSKTAPPLAIKDAADSALALTARGQTRWSRAILSKQWRKRKLLLKAGGRIRRCSSSRTRVGKSLPGLSGHLLQLKKEKENKVEERLRVLSRLVPGGRKLSAPTLLEEAADYVSALEMQVKAMRTLAELLSEASLSTGVES